MTAPGPASAPAHTILICTKCRGPRAAAKLRAALSARVPGGIGFRAVDCMAACDQPVAVGFQARAKASYVFGPIEVAQDVDALCEFASQYTQSATGWTSASDRPRALFDKTIARLPGLPLAGDR